MKDYKISSIGDRYIKNVHQVGVDHDGNYYCVIFGRYVNGGFCSIPNWNVGCELADFDDVLWNKNSLGKALDDREAGVAIARAIAEFARK